VTDPALPPLRVGADWSSLADRDELRFREEIEPELRNERVAAWMERRELVAKLEWVLARARLEPAGTVVDLGAGSCWLGAHLAKRPAVERVICVEFSRRRLEELAPQAIAALGAPPAKIERLLADFHAPGLADGCADLVVTDAAFHHAADPVALARVAHAALRPGGVFLLHREPTLAMLRRTRDHGLEGQYGGFEHEYSARGYLQRLSAAGFADVRKIPAAGSFRGRKACALLRPPLAWLNGIAFAEYAYMATRR
jgi:SAM-dependent methyltransferase